MVKKSTTLGLDGESEKEISTDKEAISISSASFNNNITTTFKSQHTLLTFFIS